MKWKFSSISLTLWLCYLEFTKEIGTTDKWNNQRPLNYQGQVQTKNISWLFHKSFTCASIFIVATYVYSMQKKMIAHAYLNQNIKNDFKPFYHRLSRKSSVINSTCHMLITFFFFKTRKLMTLIRKTNKVVIWQQPFFICRLVQLYVQLDKFILLWP